MAANRLTPIGDATVAQHVAAWNTAKTTRRGARTYADPFRLQPIQFLTITAVPNAKTMRARAAQNTVWKRDYRNMIQLPPNFYNTTNAAGVPVVNLLIASRTTYPEIWAEIMKGFTLYFPTMKDLYFFIRHLGAYGYPNIGNNLDDIIIGEPVGPFTALALGELKTAFTRRINRLIVRICRTCGESQSLFNSAIPRQVRLLAYWNDLRVPPPPARQQDFAGETMFRIDVSIPPNMPAGTPLNVRIPRRQCAVCARGPLPPVGNINPGFIHCQTLGTHINPINGVRFVTVF